MKEKIDNTRSWNEAARVGLVFGALSSACLVLKNLSELSGSAILTQAAYIILWAVEFFGCILLMKKYMLDLKDKYEGVRMEDTFRFGRRVALLSGLILASVNAVILMKVSPGTMESALEQASSMMSLSASQREELGPLMDRLPLISFLAQWLYCFLYGTVLASILSRYIFVQNLFDSARREQEKQDSDRTDTPEEQ